ncbi:MAG: hypothetical protein J6S52_00525 [Prevotella sp.]|nr:hypothetical protein [Prevotella sp.]
MTRKELHELPHQQGIYEKRAHEAADIIIDQMKADIRGYCWVSGINEYVAGLCEQHTRHRPTSTHSSAGRADTARHGRPSSMTSSDLSTRQPSRWKGHARRYWRSTTSSTLATRADHSDLCALSISTY